MFFLVKLVLVIRDQIDHKTPENDTELRFYIIRLIFQIFFPKA